MSGVPRELVEHALNIYPNTQPVKQTLRRFSEQKRRAIGEEINRLRDANFIRELQQATWVANPVLVPKKNTKKLRMCVDFTSLNKHCPKDHFPLPRIDQIVDSTAGCARLSFLDAYSGYHQIRMKVEDEDKTAFITPYGVFCYTTMPFGLKNAGATYQRCMQACLKDQIGRNVQVYVDDIVIKTKLEDDLLEDLKETFASLQRYKIKLNPTKCVFGVPSGQLLGYLVSARGIEANPEKIQAILTMAAPTNLKGVQQLTGRIAALSRFIGRLGDKGLPFYRLMKKTEKFQWTEEAQIAFMDLKRILSTPPILAAPQEEEPMWLYIAATNQVVSTVLVVEREEEGRVHKVQRPVYYVSEVLSSSKQRYPHYQKLVYGVFMTARKLSHYFQSHPITVVSNAPLSSIINNPEATGRVAKWAIELSPWDMRYESRKAIKSQILADFVAEWTEVQTPKPPDISDSWTMHFDGSKRQEGAGAGVVLTSPRGDKMRYVLQINFKASNNDAEYEALLHGMRMAIACGATRLMIYGDSDLVVQQTMNTCNAISDNMIAYRAMYNLLEASFDGCEVHHISRNNNEEADQLANIGSTRGLIPPSVFLEQIDQRSIKVKPAVDHAPLQPVAESPTDTPAGSEALHVMATESTWMQPFLDYLLRKELPTDPTDARRIVRRAKAFTVVNSLLYKRSVTEVLQKCIRPTEGREILLDIHEGTCGHHASSRALVAKAFRAGFYWPTTHQDAKVIV